MRASKINTSNSNEPHQTEAFFRCQNVLSLRCNTFSPLQNAPLCLDVKKSYQKGSNVSKKILLVIILLVSPLVHATEFISRSALGDKVSLKVPTNFAPMTKEILELKYPSSRRPTEVLSNETGGVSLAFNHTNNRIKPEQLKEAHKVLSKTFHNMYPFANWLRDEIFVRNGKDYIVLELVTPAMDTSIHNIMYATSVDGRLLLVSFNTTIEESKVWLPIGKEIMKSLVIN